jgi:hypothetical protein
VQRGKQNSEYVRPVGQALSPAKRGARPERDAGRIVSTSWPVGDRPHFGPENRRDFGRNRLDLRPRGVVPYATNRSLTVAAPMWGRMASCGRLAIGQLPGLRRPAAVTNRRAG